MLPTETLYGVVFLRRPATIPSVRTNPALGIDTTHGQLPCFGGPTLRKRRVDSFSLALPLLEGAFQRRTSTASRSSSARRMCARSAVGAGCILPLLSRPTRCVMTRMRMSTWHRTGVRQQRPPSHPLAASKSRPRSSAVKAETPHGLRRKGSAMKAKTTAVNGRAGRLERFGFEVVHKRSVAGTSYWLMLPRPTAAPYSTPVKPLETSSTTRREGNR